MAEPAWKKLGLKVSDSGDSGVSVAHIDSAQLTNRDVKAINKQKRKLEHGNNGTKKPPKRVKVPKSERKPPPEKDQLFYLRQYTTDRDNWKFSKQKQNWILKNIETIPEKYHHDLIAYLEGIQGGSRLRLLEEMQAVVERWNAAANAAEEKIREGNGETEGNGEEKNGEEKSEKEGPTYTYAVRCRDIIKALTEEFIPLSGVDETETEEKNESETEETAEETEEKAESPEVHDEEDNLIIEEVDVAGVQPEPPLAFEEKEHEEGKKEKKEKKEKKKKDRKEKKEKKKKDKSK